MTTEQLKTRKRVMEQLLNGTGYTTMQDDTIRFLSFNKHTGEGYELITDTDSKDYGKVYRLKMPAPQTIPDGELVSIAKDYDGTPAHKYIIDYIFSKSEEDKKRDGFDYYDLLYYQTSPLAFDGGAKEQYNGFDYLDGREEDEIPMPVAEDKNTYLDRKVNDCFVRKIFARCKCVIDCWFPQRRELSLTEVMDGAMVGDLHCDGMTLEESVCVYSALQRVNDGSVLVSQFFEPIDGEIHTCDMTMYRVAEMVEKYIERKCEEEKIAEEE